MDPKKIARINKLWPKEKNGRLNSEESGNKLKLREEYSFRGLLAVKAWFAITSKRTKRLSTQDWQ